MRWSMPPNATLKSEYAVNMFFCYSLASSYIVMRVDMLSYMFLLNRKPSTVSLKIPSDSAVWVPMMVGIDVHSLSMQIMKAMGR
jgi:hypothetical protein